MHSCKGQSTQWQSQNEDEDRPRTSSTETTPLRCSSDSPARLLRLPPGRGSATEPSALEVRLRLLLGCSAASAVPGVWVDAVLGRARLPGLAGRGRPAQAHVSVMED